VSYEEHDGSEHFGARSPRSRYEDPAVDTELGEDRYEGADEWFGDDDFDLDLAPPPPYAQKLSPEPAPTTSSPPEPAPFADQSSGDSHGPGQLAPPGPLAQPQPSPPRQFDGPAPAAPSPDLPPDPLPTVSSPDLFRADATRGGPETGPPSPAVPDASGPGSEAHSPESSAPKADDSPAESVRSRFGRNRPQLRQLLEEAQQRSAPPPPPPEDVPEPEPLPPLDFSGALTTPPPGPAPTTPPPAAPAWRDPHPPRREDTPPPPVHDPRTTDPETPRSTAASPTPSRPASAKTPPWLSSPSQGNSATGPATFAPPVVTPGREWSGGYRPGAVTGWRRAVRSITFGLINPGNSRAERRRQEMIARACTHVVGGHHRVAVLSLKGGVGKTTTTAALGSMLASLRGDRVLAIDANPDRGTLSDKLHLETPTTIRDLLNEKDTISRYADIRAFTSQAPSRLEVLASDQDPAVSEALSEYDYREVARIVEHFYSITLTDCGTGLLHSAMRGVLGLADQIIVVSTPSVDGARSASATLDWLDAHDYGSLVRGAVVVMSMVRRNSKSNVDLQRLEEHFASRCRAVVRVPWDPHLDEGAEIYLDRLQPSTHDAYLELAATVGEAFAWPR